ncbi:MAG: hypothetical protein IT252_10000 [Chitinophagaceae bacterium]|nr:hypothetical protein [Chitinophagaceae bacterium]
MIYLLWSLLNIGIFIFFIATCFKATKLVREKLGLFASIIFVFGLLSFIGNSSNDNDNKEPNSNHIKTWKFVSEDSLKSNDSYLLDIDLEKTLIAKYYLGIKYGKDKQGRINVPISAYSSANGFISGTNWKPISIIVNTTDDNNKFEYSVDGVVEWKLLGATIYSELKEYKGIAMTK